ncbi:putative cytidylyltransferase family protein [Rosellinia necatrix]|uniref:Putative cytidylyltransferase family protein n=1 Tax=Rosellinia necatrix TaxID=77044 RepID=A0A1W2TKY7_ROSNE|nr:putative cytidylyltransferase family protein [Rosellinia necatrix]
MARPPPPHLAALFAQALRTFEASGATFRVLCSLPAPPPSPPTSAPDAPISAPPPPPRTRPPRVLVLDSSFNPPTRAHHRMAASALGAWKGKGEGKGEGEAASRVLLLLAVNNADKAPRPAALAHRLAMMYAFARALLAARPTTTKTKTTTTMGGEGCIAEEGGEGGRGGGGCETVVVDIAVTTEPYFHAKALAIDASGFYAGVVDGGDDDDEAVVSAAGPEQVYLAGYDTLVRIFDPKYYPADGGMRAALDPLFACARLRVTMRTDDAWGDAARQVAYLDELRAGKLEAVGGRKEWVDRIELVEGRKDGEEIISSTKVRDAVRRRDWEALRELVDEGVVNWIRENDLYANDDQ